MKDEVFMDDQHLYKTKVVFEIEMNHWSTVNPQQAIEFLYYTLRKPQAVTTVKPISAESNYINHGRDEPSEEFTKVEISNHNFK